MCYITKGIYLIYNYGNHVFALIACCSSKITSQNSEIEWSKIVSEKLHLLFTGSI